MTPGDAILDLEAVLDASFARRGGLRDALAGEAEAVARVCRAMAERFRQGGRLLVFGAGLAAVDARHIAVEFLHPVIVGKRALPALALTNDVSTLTDPAGPTSDHLFARSVRVLARPGDIALGLSLDGRCASVAGGLDAARALGLLAIALTGGARDTAVARAANHAIVLEQHDWLSVREGFVTTYHVLWELVHVFLEGPVEAERS